MHTIHVRRWSLERDRPLGVATVLWMQRLDLIVTLLLVRQRQPAGWHLGFGVLGLPSGLLAMICEALTKLESQIEARSRFFGVPCLPSLGRASRLIHSGTRAVAAIDLRL